jgi:hypothetical protein
VVASSRQQRLLTPLVVGMISSILNLVAERANATKEPLSPTLRVLLDEAANIAPIRDLGVHLSQAAGPGVRIATIWQSLAQIHERYARGADDILANSTAKLFLGPVTDHTRHRRTSEISLARSSSVPTAPHLTAANARERRRLQRGGRRPTSPHYNSFKTTVRCSSKAGTRQQ